MNQEDNTDTFETEDNPNEDNPNELFKKNNANSNDVKIRTIGETGSPFGASKYGKRLDYSQPQWNDVIFAILFIAHLIVMFIALIVAWSAKSTSVRTADSGFVIILACALIGAVFGMIWMQILQRYSGYIIKMMLWINLVLLVVGMILNFVIGQVFGGIAFLILLIIFGLYMYAVWGRIPFATVLLGIATTIIQSYSGTILLALGILCVQILWILWWSATTAAYMSQSNSSGGIIFLLLISFYWTLEVLKNISHTTTCGVAATWYFTTSPSFPTKPALKRACTYSFGSICFGSLLVAFVQTLRALVRVARGANNNNIFLCAIDCLITCFDGMIQYFNTYAYAQVAIYGRAYIESAKATWDLLCSKGIDALINDDLTGFALLCGSFIGGIVCAIVAVLMAHNNSSVQSYTTAFGVIGFTIGFFLCMTILHVVRSAIVTLFVCYAEDPNALKVNHEQECNKFEQARAQAYPNYNVRS